MILRAVERGAEHGVGTVPLVMLHGLFGRAANFGGIQTRLAARRRVLALDLRGHGGSPHARPIDYPAMAEDVRETLQAHAALPCALLGHSMGGKVAMRLALTRPEAVERLVVADIAPVTYPSHFAGFVAAMQSLPLSPGLTRAAAEAALAPAVQTEAVRRFLLQNLQVGSAPAWTCDLAGIAASLPAIEAWPAIAAAYDGPTLVLSGARSDYVQPEAWPGITALFPRARPAVLPDAGHWLHAENPDGFHRLVEAFLDS